MIEKSKTVICEKHELEYQDNPKTVEQLPFLVNQDSNCDVQDKFHFLKNKLLVEIKNVSIDTWKWKKYVELVKKEF